MMHKRLMVGLSSTQVGRWTKSTSCVALLSAPRQPRVRDLLVH